MGPRKLPVQVHTEASLDCKEWGWGPLYGFQRKNSCPGVLMVSPSTLVSGHLSGRQQGPRVQSSFTAVTHTQECSIPPLLA